MSIEGLFFDFDGVIADTETCWVQTIVSYCAARGIALDRRTLYSYLGDGDVQMLRYLGMCCGAASETLLAELRPLFQQRTEQLTLRPGIRTYIEYAQKRNLRLALVSNSTAPYIDRWLKKLGLQETFSCVVTRTPELPGKPAPDLYLAALQKTGLAARHVLAVEDSMLGLRAACAAGVCAVAYPNEATREEVTKSFSFCANLGSISPQALIDQTEHFYRQMTAG